MLPEVSTYVILPKKKFKKLNLKKLNLQIMVLYNFI
jgi:hypothetical protein